MCYKETTEGGSRTKDSTFAQEIYYELTNAGYHVFFSRITLEEKLGTEYEPYIFAALNSAKVMVVVGTSAENFNAVWVKNEWSRFLSIMKNDRSRMLIPCYRDMDPYDLPDELAMLQSQDMDKIGFIQDITRGIEKVLESTAKKTTVEASPEIVLTPTLERLIQNSDTYLKLENYSAAHEVFTRITKEYPEDYRGWWGLIVCETKGLSEVAKDLSSLNTWFKYTKQLSSEEAFVSLEAEYVAYIKIAAEGDVEHELSEVYKILNTLNSSIETFIEQRKQVEQQKQQLSFLLENQLRNADESILEAERNIDIKNKGEIQARQMVRGGKIVLGAGIFLFFIGIWWDGNASYADYWISGVLGILGLACGLIGFIMWLVSSDVLRKSRYDGQISHVQTQLKIAEEAKIDNRKQYDKDVCEFDSKITNINKEIQQAEERIAECEKYLLHGKDKMAEMFWAQRCKSIGVNQQFDVSTEQLRKAAWGSK
ncbi:MAG: toll/interleukin-1 receptor domain-containing protein [Muricomes sp.]